jgi:hypothetical protein
MSKTTKIATGPLAGDGSEYSLSPVIPSPLEGNTTDRLCASQPKSGVSATFRPSQRYVGVIAITLGVIWSTDLD